MSFNDAMQDGNFKLIKRFLTEGVIDPAANSNFPIQLACCHGHIEIVKLLLADPRVDPGDDNNYAIQIASHNGHLEIVKLLLADIRVDPSAADNKAIGYAFKNGHLEIVNLLKADQERYPTYLQRQHNLPLDQKISKLKKQMEDVYFINRTTTNSLTREALSVVYSNLELQVSNLKKIYLRLICNCSLRKLV